MNILPYLYYSFYKQNEHYSNIIPGTEPVFNDIEEYTCEKIFEYNGKTYSLKENKLNVKCAGLPDNLKELVTFDNFKVGLTLHGKLLPKRYEGGVILEETDFTIN